MNSRQIEAFFSEIAAAGIVADLYFKACSAPANTLTGWSLEDRNPEIVDPPIVFERYGQEAAHDREYVNRC